MVVFQSLILTVKVEATGHVPQVSGSPDTFRPSTPPEAMWPLAVAAIVSTVALTSCLLFWLLRKNPVHRGDRAGWIRPRVERVITGLTPPPYEIKDFQAPRVSGHLFQLLVWFSFTRLGYLLLVRDNIRKSNMRLFRGEYIPEEPTYKPLVSNEVESPARLSPQVFLGLHRQRRRENGFFRPSILDYHQAYRSGRCTPVDVAKLVLAAIRDSNKREPPLRAIVESYDSVVMAMAEASALRWEKGETLSLLDGVPVSVKGEVFVEPYPFFCGTIFKPAVLEGVVEGTNVRCLKEGGAIIIGISNMQELGKGTMGSNPHQKYQTPRNPYDTDRYCGGSTSGGAAGVASGLCPLALGGDGGGSIRVPASLCGVVGLKPTYDLLDSCGGTPTGFTVGVPGPICTSSLDAAIALSILDNRKRVSLTGLESEGVSGLRVGVYWEYFEHASEDVVKACQKGLDALVELGAELKEVIIPELEEAKIAHMSITLTESATTLSCEIDKHFWDFNPETLPPLLGGLHTSGVDYVNSLKQRTRSMRILESLFEEVDVIATPSVACIAPKIFPNSLSHGQADLQTSGQLMRFAFLANLTGIPALAVPVGVSSDGLPVGLQFMGSWHSEALLLRVGYTVENALGDATPKPQVFYNTLPCDD